MDFGHDEDILRSEGKMIPPQSVEGFKLDMRRNYPTPGSYPLNRHLTPKLNFQIVCECDTKLSLLYAEGTKFSRYEWVGDKKPKLIYIWKCGWNWVGKFNLSMQFLTFTWKFSLGLVLFFGVNYIALKIAFQNANWYRQIGRFSRWSLQIEFKSNGNFTNIFQIGWKLKKFSSDLKIEGIFVLANRMWIDEGEKWKCCSLNRAKRNLNKNCDGKEEIGDSHSPKTDTIFSSVEVCLSMRKSWKSSKHFHRSVSFIFGVGAKDENAHREILFFAPLFSSSALLHEGMNC